MKKYVVDSNGDITQHNGAFDIQGKPMNKNIDVLSGDGTWKHWYGFKLFVDNGGVVIKGMEPFVGRAFSDLNKVGYVEGLSVHNSIRNALQATHKSLLSENNKVYAENMRRITEYLDMAIAKAKLRNNG